MPAVTSTSPTSSSESARLIVTHWLGQVSTPDGRASAGWLFTSRRGGVSSAPFDEWNLGAYVGDAEESVANNRRIVGEVAGLSDIVFMRQCHSADVAVVTDASVAEVVDVDALVTSSPDLGVAALSADCVPVALVDAEAGVVAAVHSGWQGMVSDVVGAAVARMESLGATRSNLRVALGPAICGRCYPVPPDRAARAAEAWPASAAVSADGQPAIDVRAGLVQRLDELGITAELVGGCTAEDPHLFSYRRDQLTGRQGVAVWWREHHGRPATANS